MRWVRWECSHQQGVSFIDQVRQFNIIVFKSVGRPIPTNLGCEHLTFSDISIYTFLQIFNSIISTPSGSWLFIGICRDHLKSVKRDAKQLMNFKNLQTTRLICVWKCFKFGLFSFLKLWTCWKRLTSYNIYLWGYSRAVPWSHNRGVWSTLNAPGAHSSHRPQIPTSLLHLRASNLNRPNSTKLIWYVDIKPFM